MGSYMDAKIISTNLLAIFSTLMDMIFDTDDGCSVQVTQYKIAYFSARVSPLLWANLPL